MARPTPADDLLPTIRHLAATLAATPHDKARSAGGRCNCLPCRTERLAARGWPSGVGGDETGIRSTTTGSPTERAAAIRDAYGQLSERLALHAQRLCAEALAILAIAAVVDSHAGDDDPLPAGHGPCRCGCGHVCRPGRNPDDRLRSGLAPACYRRWLRWRAAYPGVTIADYITACARERVSTA